MSVARLTRMFHVAISVDIDRHSDARLETDWLSAFRGFVGFDVKTVADVRRVCQWARSCGWDVFPPCDNTGDNGHCLGHPFDELAKL